MGGVPAAGRQGHSPGRRRGRALWAALALAALVLAALATGFLSFVGTLADRETRPASRVDGIVVLTGGASRLQDGLQLLAAGHGRRLLITGVHWATTTEELAHLAPAREQLFDCCVDIDKRATNTVGNAVEAADWARRHGFRTLLVVTSSYHMPRSLAELEVAAPGVALVPYPVVTERMRAQPWWTSVAMTRLLFLEYVKYILARVRIGLETATADRSLADATRRQG